MALSQLVMKSAGGQEKLISLLLNPSKPAEIRAKMLVDLMMASGGDPAMLHGVVSSLFQQMAVQKPPAEAELEQLKAQYQQALAELEQGPARPATFIAEADGIMPGPKPRAHVVTPDGQERYPSLHPEVKIDDLEPGMTVYLDPKGAIVLGKSRRIPRTGQETTFLRQLPETGQVEVSVHDERIVLHASKRVLDQLADGMLKRGDRVLMCPRREFAFDVIPADKDRRHRFVDGSKVPNVVASRDIGKPHWSLGWLLRRTRILLFRQDLLRHFDLRPRFAMQMIGPPGTGKTLTIRAFLHEFDKMLAERTGRKDIGSRVIRAKIAELYSEWLARSEKNIEELFDDIQAIASEEVETVKGERLVLPVVVIVEEAEAMGRRRGEWDGTGGVFDRIIGTLLQRLDDPTDDLAKLPLIFIATSNRPDLIDSGFDRRLGMKARFSRLDREGLAAVLGKKLKPEYPYASRNGHAAAELRREIIDQVVGWLFSPNGEDTGQVEVTLRDGKKIVKHRRDFLTGAVIEQCVSNAIDQLVFAAEESGYKHIGLTGPCLIDSLRRHIDGMADVLTAHNVADYVDLPDHSHVAHVRRLHGSNGHLAALLSEEE